MTTTRKHVRNLLANWIGQASGMVVVFLLSPFVVHRLGPTEYGIWSLLNVFTGYLGVLDFGVRASTGRYLILYIGGGDHRRADETLRTGLTVFSLVSVLIAAAAVACGWIIPCLFTSIPPEYYGVLRLLMPLLALNIWLSAVSGTFASVLAAHERFDLSQTVDVSVLLLRTAATVAVIFAGHGIVGMTLVAVAASALAVAGNWAVARRIYPRLRAWPLRISRDRLREIFGYGLPAFFGTVVASLMGQTDLVIVGALIGVSAVTAYSIGAMLVLYSWPFIGQINGTAFPSIQRLTAAGDPASVQQAFVRLLKIVLLVGIPIYLGFLMFGDVFIRLWMGPSFAESSVIMAILSVARVLLLVPACACLLLYATGNVWFVTAVTAAEAVLAVTLAVLLVTGLGWGLPGVAIAGLTSLLVARGVFLPWYACRRIGLRIGTLVAKVLLPAAATAVIFATWCLLVRQCVEARSWISFSVQVILALSGYAPVALGILAPKADRARVWQMLKTLAWGTAAADDQLRGEVGTVEGAE